MGLIYNRHIRRFQVGGIITSKPSFASYYKTVPEYKNDTTTYSLQSAYKYLPYKQMKAFAESEAHLPDTYKKPSHPSFSIESIYNNPKKGIVGGKWDIDNTGNDIFIPSTFNISNFGSKEKLVEWFKRNEPGVKIIFK